jgi:hypothetical protein
MCYSILVKLPYMKCLHDVLYSILVKLPYMECLLHDVLFKPKELVVLEEEKKKNRGQRLD